MGYRLCLLLSLWLYMGAATAYVGPGLGLGAAGAVVGLIVTILLAILGVIWYPLKRLIRRDDSTAAHDEGSDES
jgi:hypothetical protein